MVRRSRTEGFQLLEAGALGDATLTTDVPLGCKKYRGTPCWQHESLKTVICTKGFPGKRGPDVIKFWVPQYFGAPIVLLAPPLNLHNGAAGRKVWYIRILGPVKYKMGKDGTMITYMVPLETVPELRTNQTPPQQPTTTIQTDDLVSVIHRYLSQMGYMHSKLCQGR